MVECSLSQFARRRGNGSYNTTKGGLVSPRTEERLPYDPLYKSANEEWKSRWGSHVAWSTMIAVAIHAAIFAFWPRWEISVLELDSDLEILGTELISLLYQAPSRGGTGVGGGGGLAEASLTLLEEPDSLPVELDVGYSEVGAGVGIEGSALAFARFSGVLRQRLLGRGGPVPTIVEPAPASTPFGLDDDPVETLEDVASIDEDSSTDEELSTDEDLSTNGDSSTDGDSSIDENSLNVGDPSVVDLAPLFETSPLDLSRLSAVRPELVLAGTSAWILIRNPAEVDRYMIGNGSRLDPGAEGLVDVAVWIDEFGSVEWAEISRSSGLQEMDEVALGLFSEVASFRPARQEGVRVSMSVIFSVPFPW